jgi:hypothetical protein
LITTPPTTHHKKKQLAISSDVAYNVTGYRCTKLYNELLRRSVKIRLDKEKTVMSAAWIQRAAKRL